MALIQSHPLKVLGIRLDVVDGVANSLDVLQLFVGDSDAKPAVHLPGLTLVSSCCGGAAPSVSMCSRKLVMEFVLLVLHTQVQRQSL